MREPLLWLDTETPPGGGGGCDQSALRELHTALVHKGSSLRESTHRSELRLCTRARVLRSAVTEVQSEQCSQRSEVREVDFSCAHEPTFWKVQSEKCIQRSEVREVESEKCSQRSAFRLCTKARVLRSAIRVVVQSEKWTSLEHKNTNALQVIEGAYSSIRKEVAFAGLFDRWKTRLLYTKRPTKEINYMKRDLQKRRIDIKRDVQKRPICMERDLLHEKRPAKGTYHMKGDLHKRRIYIKRDVYIWKETVYILKETYICEERRIYIKRDVNILKET